MALVLAIEPDLRQAAIVKRIVREKVMADVAVVDSRDAALEAMRTTVPDVLLLSALLSPRDEDELIAHLRTLDNADHLQTHTIPQLASALEPSGGRAAGGLLSAFRRKKKAVETQTSGCDPDIFAEEIRSYLERAAEQKREHLEARTNENTPQDKAWRTGATHVEKAPEANAAQAEPEDTASSSWSSPFEWKPSNPSSLISNPYSRVVDADHPADASEPVPQVTEPLISASVAADSFSPEVGAFETSINFDAAPLDINVHADAFVHASAPPDGDVFAHAEPPVHADAPIAADAFARFDAPTHADAPVDTDVFARSDASHHADVRSHATVSTHADSIYVDAPVQVEAPLYGEAETPVYVDAPIHVEAPASMREAGPRDPRPTSKRKRLGALASWMRSERTPPAGSGSADDLRVLLGSLAIPAAVAAVAYPRGVRIRRVRVPAAREPRITEPAGAVILSKRLLAEERERRTNA
jgi:CheY-like chemotaxis protein